MVRVRLFASLREAAGVGEISLVLDSASTARQLFDELVGRLPELAGLQAITLVAVNESYGTWDTVVHPGDEIAFFPPVSGGAPWFS